MTKHAFLENNAQPVPQAAGMDHCPFLPVFGPPSVMFVRGQGTELWDSQGKRYLDFLCGLAVTSLGHSHSCVTDALTQQSAELIHVSNFFANPVATAAAIDINDLLESATGSSGQVFFCNSGAEANEAAIKLARKHGGRGRHTMVSALGSFHGRTLGALAATGQPAKHEPFQPMPEGFKHVAFGDIDAMSLTVDSSVAAVLLEPIQGEGGVIPAPAGYLKAVESLCKERGVLLIIDEVQTGMGRTGDWFGYEYSGITPDVITLAKGLGGGLPLGAMIALGKAADLFQPGDHGSTFGGNPVTTAAGLAAIKFIETAGVLAKVEKQGAHLMQELAVIPGVAEVRGAGLLLGIELNSLKSADIANALRAEGVLVNAANPTTIRIAPALIVTDAQIKKFIAIFKKVMSDAK